MANTIQGKASQSSRSSMPSFGAFPGNRASVLLEKTHPGLRRSTPDSEALASSDDENEQTRAAQQALNSRVARAARRTSWLNEMPSQNRKPSMTLSGGPYSPTTSHPATPSGDQGTWPSNASPALTGSGAWNSSTSYPWGGGIWNSENRIQPPSRLQEVLASPTAINAPMAKFLVDDHSPQIGNRDTTDAGLPVSIPLQPTFKSYRSQSYSVGQLDNATINPESPMAPAVPNTNDGARARITSGYPGLQRRSSRQGILHERVHDSGGLGRVREDEDDEETNRDGGTRLAPSQAQMIERLERENAQLRYAAQGRERTTSTSTASNSMASSYRNIRPRGPIMEGSDLAVDDNEDLTSSATFLGREAALRRLDEQTGGYSERQPNLSSENRSVENARRAQWQTSLGFGSIIEPPQSRRHSFADVPTRQGSFSSNDRGDGEYRTYENVAQGDSQGNDREFILPRIPQASEDEMEYEYSQNRRFAAKYFESTEYSRRTAEQKVQQALAVNNPQGRYTGMGSYLGPTAQPLFIVNFKCLRSDVFYIQEGTGLEVNPGDLVIVEADRGTDLGAVQHAGVSWDQARQFKGHYAEEHYKLMMMFSQQARNGGPNAVNPNGLHGPPGSAVGGMGPAGHHGAHDSSSSDLKPKMIRRLAQNHEIKALQEKEGNEAKAKRICQSKVVEHRLNMEILDAEFQFDGKKLTFYYFADAYINFNSLVTDLFKIYKTRIWMSAINPASFVTPTASLALPPAYGAGAFGTGGESPAPRRQQHGRYVPHSVSTYDDTYDNARGPQAAQSSNRRAQYFNQYEQYGAGSQPGAYGLQDYGQGAIDSFAAYVPQQMLNPNAPNFAYNRSQDSRNRGNTQASDNSWMGRFQGLSLGS